MMARIIAPNADYTGLVAGVQIIEGVGETDDERAIAYFTRQGYTVELDADPLAEKFAEWLETKNFAKAKVPELKKFAEQHDPPIPLVDEQDQPVTKKADIIAVIEAALAEVE